MGATEEAEMPNYMANDPLKYIAENSRHPLSQAAKKIQAEKKSATRKNKPQDQWTVRDVVLEWRQKFHLRYPMHDADELGDFNRHVAIITKMKNEHDIPMAKLVRAIDVFYQKDFAERYPKYPAWKKFLWVVRDSTGESNTEAHRNSLKKTRHEATVEQQALTMEALLAGNSAAVSQRRAEKRLALRRRELEHWLDEQRRHGDWVLEEELGPNWVIILEELMKEVGYERPDEPTSGPA